MWIYWAATIEDLKNIFSLLRRSVPMSLQNNFKMAFIIKHRVLTHHLIQ